MLIRKLLIPFLLLSFLAAAQQKTKCNYSFVKAAAENKNKELCVLIKGSVDEIKAASRSLGLTFRYAAGNICAVSGKAESIQQLAAASFVKRVEMNAQHYRVLDDSSLSKSNVLPVHAGQFPLAQAYTGKDVIIGVIDTGVDYLHPDFKDSTGKSRILWIWDQVQADSVNTPQPYNYGQEWSRAQIDSGYSNHTDYTNGGHGTKVTGVAAGNGRSAYQYRGIAPEADIIFVAIDFNNSTDPTITDAVNYIFEKADAAGKPCVINISLGDYYGSHDGTDLQAQLIDNLLDAQPGRAVIAANGNGGNYPFHLGYTVDADTNFTWLASGNSAIVFDVYADTTAFSNVNFTIGATTGAYSYRGNIGFRNADTSLGIVKTDTLWNAGNRIGIISSYTDITDSLLTLSVMIEPDSAGYLWSFETTGSGYFDSWNFEYVFSNLPAAAQYPRMLHYKRTDTLQTMCTSLQCSNKVISVGNYVCRDRYIDVRDTLSFFPGVVDSIFETSSLGPTRDGRIKPDISAPGENIVTVGEQVFMNWLITNYPFIVTQDSMHMIFGGTSAASPVVAGLAALYFQQYPSATWQQLKDDMINCSIHDAYTGSSPNITYGYGKLDGFGTLTCQNPIGVKNPSSSIQSILLYPNPTEGNLTIEVPGEMKNAQIEVSDLQGKVIYATQMQATMQTIQLPSFSRGIYFVSLRTASSFATQKLVIQ